MKIKKLLALLLALVMVCGVFAVITASAEDAPEVEDEVVVEDDGYIFKAYQAETHPGWATAPTVDGFNGYFKLDGSYAITTKQTYDMNTTSIRLNSVTAPAKGQSVVIIISPDNYDTFRTKDDIDNGIITFILDFNYGEKSSRIYSAKGYTNLDKVFPKADNYEIAFSKSPVVTYDENGDIMDEYTEYAFRINGYTLVTKSEDHWIAKLMDAPSFEASNITIAASAPAKFNADIASYSGFMTSGERNLGTEYDTAAVVTGTDNDGYTVMSLDGKVAATTQGFDFTEKTLSVKPTWGVSGNRHAYGSAMAITFASERMKTKKSESDESVLTLLFGPNDRDDSSKYYKLIYVNDGSSSALNPWQATGGEAKGNFARVQTASYNNDTKTYDLPEEYNISFINTGDGKWALAVNGTYYEHSTITAFCENGGLEDAYVTVAGAGGIKAACKVIDRKVNDWVSVQKNTNAVWFNRTSKNDDGTDRNLMYKSNVQTTAERVNLFETTVDFTFDISSYNPAAFKITFSSEHGNGTLALADAAAKEDTLMFYVKNTYLAGSDIYWFGLDNTKTADGSNYKIPGWSDSWSGVTVREKGAKTTNIKFNFYKEADGTYSVYINQKKFSSVNCEKLAKFCENYGEGAFVSIASTSDDRMVCTPLLNEIATSHNVEFANIDVQKNSLRNITAYTTVADLKANVTVGKYYGVSVVNANGEAVADDAAIGSGYKMVVSYNFREAEGIKTTVDAFDIVVLGDMNGDAAVDTSDLVVLKRELLGMKNVDIYGYALNVAYDDVLNVLDYIALTKAMAE